MLPPDLALAQYFNATTKAYITQAPAYITYRERTRITASGPFVKANREIDRSVMVRQRDNFAIMQDLPAGGETQGQAFPIIPYLDPLAGFTFKYFVNLKAINIDLKRIEPPYLSIPQPDANADVMVYYLQFWKPSYLPGSTDSAPRFKVELVKDEPNMQYPAEVDIDPSSGLPKFIEVKITGDNLDVKLDYSIVEGHWIVTHGLLTSDNGIYRGVSDTTFDQFTFPATVPDPRLQ